MQPTRTLALCLTLILCAAGTALAQTAEDFLKSGDARLQAKDYAAAIAEYDKAVQFDPNDFRPYINRGYTKHLAGDNEAAVIDLDLAIQLNPNTYPLLPESGTCQTPSGRLCRRNQRLR